MKKLLIFVFVACFQTLLTAQLIESVAPDQAEQGETLEVTVTGENTLWTQGTNILGFRQGSHIIYPNPQTINSDTEIVGTLNFSYQDATGYYDVSVKNLVNGVETILEDGFFLNESDDPRITSIVPSSGMHNETLEVTVSGVNTTWTQGSNLLTFKQGSTVVNANPVTVNSDTEMVGFVTFYPFRPLGYYDVSVEETISGTELLLENGFLLYDNNDAIITSVNPDQANQGETLEVTVTGLNTNWAQGSDILSFKQGSSVIYANPQTIINDTEIVGTFNFSFDHSPGFYDVSVYDSYNDEDVVLYNGFLLNSGMAGELVSIVPDEGQQTEALTVTITGENTHFEQGSPVVFLQSSSTLIYALESMAENDTVLEADFLFNPDQTAGLYDVHVWWSDNSLVMEDGFELTMADVLPAINDLSPDNALTGETVILTITGENTHFDHPQVNNLVSLKLGNSLIFSNYVWAVDSETLKAEFTFTNSQPTGVYHLNVENGLDGLLTLENAFTLVQSPDEPYISSISPDSAVQMEVLWVTVTGVNTVFTTGSPTLMLFNDAANIDPIFENVVNDTLMEGYFDLFLSPGGDYNVKAYDLQGSWSVVKENAFFINPILSVKESAPATLAKIYPNPATDVLFIERSTSADEEMSVEILNISGKTVQTINLASRQKMIQTDISNLEKGIYLVKIFQDGAGQSLKIVIR